jgi:cold shock CspA family protein
MSATDDNNDDKAPVARLTGRVKWFNNKTGFGFITALTESDGVKKDSDVFVHHSAIKVAQEQYRYLVQGEYIEFVLSRLTASGASESKHEFQAVDVSGVKGGKLICETRWDAKASGSGSGSGFSSSRFNRSNESGSGSGSGSASDWTTVGPRKSSFVPRQDAGEWRRGESSGIRGRGGRGRGADEPASSSE